MVYKLKNRNCGRLFYFFIFKILAETNNTQKYMKPILKRERTIIK